MNGHFNWHLGESNSGEHCLLTGTETRHDFLVHENLLQLSTDVNEET